MKKSHIITLIITLLLVMTDKMNAQSTMATVPQKKVVTPAGDDELAKLRSVVETNPNDLATHEAYIKATGFNARGVEDDPNLVKQYEAWMKKFPTSPAVPYSLGHAYANKESPKAKPWLLKAVELDPKFDKAYFDLWIDGERWGDFKLSASYLLKAKEADPKNADYAFYYANSFSNTDVEKYKKMSLDVAANFPNTERGSQALYWLASHADDPKEKIAYYEQQRRDFPADKFGWTSSGMSEYFSLLLTDDPAKAQTLAQSISDLKGKDVKSWEANIELAKNIGIAKDYLKKGKATEAVAVLDKLILPRYSSAKENIELLKANALDASGKTEIAYHNLLSLCAKEPSKKGIELLKSYGNKLGKSEKNLNDDILYTRDTASRTAPNFTLDTYFTKGSSSLSDYKGKVVLITYWFPGCGPCRGEFPHFEKVVRKFKGREFVYLGINISPDQDDYVLPFMKSSGYSFIPLRDNDKWEKGPLDNRHAAPVNFLIDQQGHIIFSNFRTTEHNEASLEMMINSLLTGKAI